MSRSFFQRKISLWNTCFPYKSARKGLRDIIKSKFNNIMRVILLMLRDNGRGGLVGRKGACMCKVARGGQGNVRIDDRFRLAAI